LHGGEDYELLFTAPAKKRIPSKITGIPITRIGSITRDSQIKLQSADDKLNPLPAAGWQHFSQPLFPGKLEERHTTRRTRPRS
jgi:thiamine-monophosphate kinase